MAVQPQTPYKEYTANGSTESFALEFDCENQNHLIVLVDEVEPVVGTWSLSGGAVVFTVAPAVNKKITIQRNTPFERERDYQSYDNSFRPPAVNKDFDWIWLKLQELGVADWLLKIYVDRLHQQQEQKIDGLKNYVDLKDDELRAYLLEEIRKQGVALDQLDDYYNYLMQRLAQIAVDKGWDASFVVDGDENQHDINKTTVRVVDSIHNLLLANFRGHKVVRVSSYWPNLGKGGNTFVYDANMPRNKHNGGTIIDPTKAWDGSREQWASVDGYLPDVGVGVWGVDNDSVTPEVQAAILARGGSLNLGSGTNPTNFRTNQIKLGGFLGASTSAGFGCWVAQTKEISFTMFGAVGDASYEVDGTDDSFAMLAAIRALPRKKAVLNIEPYYYTHGNGDIRNIVLHFNGIKDLTINGNTACIQSHSNNLPVSGQAILRFDYVENARIYALNTDGRLDTRMVVGGDPNTNNDQHNVHVGSGCKDILFIACRADRAMMDGFYIYGDQHDRVATRTSDITFFECHANECYRQGSSLITGLGVKWLGGSYTNTGTCKDKVTGAQKGTSPMRGIDIEANEATYLTRAEYIIDGCLLSGNRNAGASPSNNAYGTIQNCVVKDNKYIGILVEHNAKNTKVINNKFSGNSTVDLWLDCTHPIKVILNDFKSGVTTINAPDMGAHDTTLAKVDIEHNNFEPADGEQKGGGSGFDFSDVNFSHNTLRNMSPTFVGGYSKFSYNHNTFTSTNAETTFAVRTWAGSSFKSLVGNTTTLVTGSLLGEGYTQGNIDYLANNSTSTDPNSGLYEIHKGKLIWNQLNNVPFLEGTPTTDEVAIKVNNLIGEMISRGIMQ